MKPDQIKAGSSYLLRPKYTTAKPITRRVEEIKGDMVVVEVNGIHKEVMLKTFASLAVEEVSQDAKERQTSDGPATERDPCCGSESA
jgi:hypothetical protein